MPFGRDTRVVPSNIVLDRGAGHPTETGDLGDRLGIQKLQSKFALQIAAKPLQIAKYYKQPIGTQQCPIRR